MTHFTHTLQRRILFPIFLLLLSSWWLQAQECPNDVVPPTPVCITGLQVDADPEDGIEVWATDFDAGSVDDCDGFDVSLRIVLVADSDGNPPSTTSITIPPTIAEFPVEIWVGDNSGNWSFCTTFLSVVNLVNNTDCDEDTTAPVAICEASMQIAAHPLDGAILWAQDIDEGSFDQCTGLIYRIERADDFTGTPPTTESLFFPPENASLSVVLWVSDEAGNWNNCWTELEVRSFVSIAGTIFIDDNDNCTFEEGEQADQYGGWTVRATNLDNGDIFEGNVQSSGTYAIPLFGWEPGNESDMQVELILPTGVPVADCPSSFIFTETLDNLTIVNFGVNTIDDCVLTSVDVSTPLLRRCFINTYHVNYYNHSSLTAEDATVQVWLDPFMVLESTQIPYTDLEDGILEFAIGDLEGGAAGQFWIQVTLSCDAELGMTHCVSASIQPYTCINAGPSWSGADLLVEGECDESEGVVRFTVRNTGTGSMVSPQDYRVVEDVVMYMQDGIELDAGGSEEFTFPANGATWRYEVPQVPDHPDGGLAAAFVEGCGGLTTGMVNLFPLSDDKPNYAIDCQENIGAWDPNDKAAFPTGYGEANFIEANTDIEYKIRFQNTGSDTAFNVRIEDQLSAELDWSSLTAGASSHPYRMSLSDEGLLQFFFDDIMLPDSNVNEPASHGFVKIRIKQQPDLMDGTLIENTAGIYFDFNEAVVTNTVTHTIGSEFITVGTQAPALPGIQLLVSPNPMIDQATFTLSNYEIKEGYLNLYDLQGRPILKRALDQNQWQLERGVLARGLYFYRIYDEEMLLISGKLLVH